MTSPFRRRNRSNTGISRLFIRQFTLYVMVGFIFLFVITSLGSYAQSKMNLTSLTLQKWTNHISPETLVNTLSMEIPALESYNKTMGIEAPNISNLLFEMVTSFNPKDPRTLIGSEIPGFSFFYGQVIVSGEDGNYADIPIESAPPMEVLMAERKATLEDVPPDPPVKGEKDKEVSPKLTTEGRNVVFIYHTHNRESWLPHVEGATSPNEAFHPEVNITLVGKRLSEELEKRGIGTYVDTTDIAQKLKEVNKPFSFSYHKSRQVVKEALAQQKDVTLMFDLHRDSQGKEKTTVKINGKSYARTFFVIGGRNKSYEKNQQFAEKLHKMLEKAYPGLSRGVYLKDGGNGEYNQSLSENNLLVEIGGVENNIEESYRTASALADVIADFYWEAEKVNGKVPNSEM
jgi:stage II sporulation protein P